MGKLHFSKLSNSFSIRKRKCEFVPKIRSINNITVNIKNLFVKINVLIEYHLGMYCNEIKQITKNIVENKSLT